MAQTFVVNSLGWDVDEFDGVLTLPEAISNANTVPGLDRIEFDAELVGTLPFISELVISDSLEVIGRNDHALIFRKSAGFQDYEASMLNVLAGVESFTLEGFRFTASSRGKEAPPLVSSASNVIIRDVFFDRSLREVFLRVSETALVEDVRFTGQRGNLYVSQSGTEPTDVVLRGILFSGIKKRSIDGNSSPLIIDSPSGAGRGLMSATLERIRVTDSETPYVRIEYVESVDIRRFTMDGNSEPNLRIRAGEYSLDNAIFYDNDALYVNVTGGDGTLSFVTATGNTTDGADGLFTFNDTTSVIDHSVLSGNGLGPNLAARFGAQIDVSYSMIGSAQTEADAMINYDEASIGLLTQLPDFQYYAEDISGEFIALIPTDSGNLIDAGDPDAVAGVDVPERDLAGSERIIGDAPDLGAVERNLPPVFDAAGFRAEIKRQISEAPDAVVTVALAAFFADPDGDAIVEIRAEDLEEGLSFNSDTWELSGDPAIIKRPVVTIVGVDEHGLEGGAVLSSRRQLVAAESGGSGGAPHVLWLLLIAAAGVRQTRH